MPSPLQRHLQDTRVHGRVHVLAMGQQAQSGGEAALNTCGGPKVGRVAGDDRLQCCARVLLLGVASALHAVDDG
eukprot:1789452-Alexandrium_andersonii.AAC.1